MSPASRGREKVLSPTNVVLALLCAMYLINYIVRVNVSTAAAAFQPELGFSRTQLGLIFSAFAYPYLVFQVIGGWLSDRFGARRALTVFSLIWAAATMLLGFANGLAAMIAGRVLLGLGVSALPTATRAMSNWMPTSRRGFAQGITHSCARLGNAIAPPLIAGLIAAVTWRGSFFVMGAVSLVWSIAWVLYFRDTPADHPQITGAELARLPPRLPASGSGRVRVPVARLISRMAPVTIVYFCYGWTLWFFLAWIPQFFLHAYQLKLGNSALFSSGVFLGGVAGDFIGGVVSDRVYESTGNRRRARRDLVVAGFLASMLLMVPVLFVHNLAAVAILLSLAFFAAEFTVGPMWAIPMDIAPRFSGFASGFMNSGSALAAIISPLVGGYIVDRTGRWEPTFIGSISLLLVGAVIAFWMRPDDELDEPGVEGSIAVA
jgi:sugar phosphate permease